MQARLDLVKIDPRLIVDLGCSRAASAAGLRHRYPEARWLGVDFSLPMLQHTDAGGAGWRRWLPGSMRRGPLLVCADVTGLPLRNGSAGLVWSNLLLHWLGDPLAALAEAHRLLEVGGLLMFATLGPDTLKELRAVFGDNAPHVQRFTDMHDLGDMLVHCGFADPVMDMEVLTLTYESFPAMLAELRAAGSVCAQPERRRGLMGRAAWQRVLVAAETAMRDGRWPATVEIVYGHAWRAAPRIVADGRAIVRLQPKPVA